MSSSLLQRKAHVKKIPDDWRLKILANILKKKPQNGYSPNCPEEPNGRWILGLANLTDSGFNPENAKPAPTDDLKVDEFILQPGDFLISRSNTPDKVGRTGLFNGEIDNCAYPDLMMRFRVDEENANINFMRLLLSSRTTRQYYSSHSVGSSATMVKINNEIVVNTPILLPPLPEQKAIADLLSTWDEAIEKTERLIKAKEKRFKWLLEELIGKPSRNREWENRQLKNLLTEGSKKPVSNTSKYKKITIKLRKKGVEYSDQSRVMADTRPFYIRKKGELIIGKQNFFNGSIAILDSEFDGCICSNAIMSFGIKSNISANFLFESISTDEFLKRHEMLANGTGQKELSEKEFINFQVALPSFEKQNQIAEILDLAKTEISCLNKYCEKLKTQKRGLMQKLLTGEWRVKTG